MNNSFRLIYLKGIPVEIHISWLLIFFLFSITLALSYFPSVVEGLESPVYWLAAVLTTLVVFVSVLTHEVGHSLVALREGIPIKKIVLFVFGGVAQMESEPKSPAAEFKVTAAGPLTSLVIALIAGALYYLLLPSGKIIGETVYFIARLNLIMAVFNLIPAFPLDGGRLFRSIVWYFGKNILSATRIAVGLGSVISFVAMAFGFMLIFFQGDLWGLWLIFIGWMIYQAGQSSYSQLIFKETFAGMKVSQLMSTELQTVSPDDSLEQLAECFLTYKYGAFPVVYGSSTHGLVSLQNMKEVPREKWAETRVSRILTPLKEALVFHPDTDAADAMMKMASLNAGRALVMDDGELVGLLSRTDMMRFMQMHMVLGSD
ncbi:MAG: site-2 protease family protein [Bacillota bacterium]|nr:site-2 protease family protein [Bacillota bacterium]